MEFNWITNSYSVVLPFLFIRKQIVKDNATLKVAFLDKRHRVMLLNLVDRKNGNGALLPDRRSQECVRRWLVHPMIDTQCATDV